MIQLGACIDSLQAWIYLYFLQLKPTVVPVANPHYIVHGLLSNGVSTKTLLYCLVFLPNLTIKYQDDMETFIMPFKAFS